MKGKTTQTTSRSRSKGATDFKRLRALRDSEIDFSDIPKLGKSFWATAKLTLPEPKDRLTIRVDHDVVQWLKKRGKGYQTRINAILRSYMEAQSNNPRSPHPTLVIPNRAESPVRNLLLTWPMWSGHSCPLPLTLGLTLTLHSTSAAL